MRPIAEGWIVGADGQRYPPEPWFLGGDFAVGVFLVRREDLPPSVTEDLADGARLLTLFGRVIVGVAAVAYTPGGVLAYDELLVAVPVLHRRRVRVTIPQIWVTSPESRVGGRELWGIPKGLMSASRRARGRQLDASYRASGGGLLASVSAVGGAALPGVWNLPMPIVQRLDGVMTVSQNSVRGSVRTARTTWSFSGPLAWLAGRRPVVSLAIVRAAVVFGRRSFREASRDSVAG